MATKDDLTTWEIGQKNEAYATYFAGQSYLADMGDPQLHVGDVVSIAPGVKHWHGATKDSWFQHIALAVPAENASAEWLEPVSDSDYLAL